MLSEKLAQSLTEQQLRDLIKLQGRRANRNLTKIRTKGVAELSGAMQSKVEPYLKRHGRTNRANEKVFQTATKGKTKRELITQLLNIQYFNEHVGTITKIKKRAEQTAKDFQIDLSDVKRFWRLVKYGYNSVGYRVDSGALTDIIRNRIRAGQKDDTIRRAIRRASERADNADDYLTTFSNEGKWI